MARSDRYVSWLAVIAFLFFGLFLYLVVSPLPHSTSQAQMAARPVVRFELPPVPAWPAHAPRAVGPGLSLADVAG